ncbi:hypothetical protein NDU88_006211 [Pleurodeles waltl]|uniref:Uncharacterized protein n=1 Tax=Pleurodeles waltl TaxID=8319 RepID=A0AAV7MD95_PLEWA|nr:hypothetical protein NDU88_006211 [Pleurodeles waltl]
MKACNVNYLAAGAAEARKYSKSPRSEAWTRPGNHLCRLDCWRQVEHRRSPGEPRRAKKEPGKSGEPVGAAEARRFRGSAVQERR